MRARRGTATVAGDVDVLLTGDCDVYKPDGEVLCMLRRGAVSTDAMDVAFPALRHIGKKYLTDNRGSYMGYKSRAQGAGKTRRTRNEHGERIQVASAIVGYYEAARGGRLNWCRATAFTQNEPEQWQTLLPMIGEVAGVFKKAAPERYARQLERANATHPAYVIAGTPFTTLTVNNNVNGSIHTDKGDFKDGLGVISVLRAGSYRGGWTTFPEYRCGVDLQHGDVLFFNSHDWHGVTAFEDAADDFERISVVYYYRDRMVECGSPEEERARIKAKTGAIE